MAANAGTASIPGMNAAHTSSSFPVFTRGILHHLAVFGVLMMACDEQGAVSQDVPDQVALDELPRELGRALCPKMLECCTSEELAKRDSLGTGAFESVEACADLYAGFGVALLVPSIREAQEQGRLVYHAERAGSCLAALHDVSCSTFAELESDDATVPGCDEMLEPLVEHGGACESSDECKSGYCQLGEEAGTCATLPAQGDACDFECADGLYCAAGENGRTCQQRLAAGSTCTSDEACESNHCSGLDQSGTPGACVDSPMCDGE